MAQSRPSHHAEKEGNNMIAGVFEIRRFNTMGFAPVLKPALAAVVNISSSRIVKTVQAPFGPFFDDPFFRQFFGDQFLTANAA
jgi:S1-C subfamily serine protease